jgi:hypothetical protein
LVQKVYKITGRKVLKIVKQIKVSSQKERQCQEIERDFFHKDWERMCIEKLWLSLFVHGFFGMFPIQLMNRI